MDWVEPGAGKESRAAGIRERNIGKGPASDDRPYSQIQAGGPLFQGERGHKRAGSQGLNRVLAVCQPVAVMSLLEVERLTKSYRQMGGESTLAIQEVSLEVSEAEFVSLVGPSGCGKTTLLMCIAGLIPPSGGRVLIKGVEVNGPPANLVLVFQEFNKSLFA